MFRFNNPDALLVLLLVAAAYAFTRALEDGRVRWIVATGALVGFGFLAKELQAFLVLPAFGLVYLLAGPPQLRVPDRARRVARTDARLSAGGWWVAIVQLWPASSRPYIGGSQNNSFWNVLFGYNGFGRLTGNESGSVGGGAAATRSLGPDRDRPACSTRSSAGRSRGCCPAALIFLVAGLAFTATRAAHRSHPRRARALGRLAASLTGLAFSSRPGHHPRVLLGRARTGDRCDRRHRCDDVLGAPRQPVRARLPRLRDRGHRALVVSCC